MVLRIVLEGVDNASDDIEKTSNKTKILGQELDDTTLAAAGLLLAVNGLASGLNQVSGGMRKFADSGERAGYVSEQNAESIRGWSDTLEFAAGPLEIIAGLANFVAAVAISAKFIPALLKGSKVAAAFGFVITGVGAVVGSLAFVIGALVASLLLLGYVLYTNRERIRELNQEYVDLGGRLDWLTRKFNTAADSVNNFTDAVTHPGRTLTNMKGRLEDEFRGVSLSRLA